MSDKEVKGYRIGHYGWFEVFDHAGKRRRWVQGEIIRLIPVSEVVAWALIRTSAGTGAYRIW